MIEPISPSPAARDAWMTVGSLKSTPTHASSKWSSDSETGYGAARACSCCYCITPNQLTTKLHILHMDWQISLLLVVARASAPTPQWNMMMVWVLARVGMAKKRLGRSSCTKHWSTCDKPCNDRCVSCVWHGANASARKEVSGAGGRDKDDQFCSSAARGRNH